MTSAVSAGVDGADLFSDFNGLQCCIHFKKKPLAYFSTVFMYLLLLSLKLRLCFGNDVVLCVFLLFTKLITKFSRLSLVQTYIDFVNLHTQFNSLYKQLTKPCTNYSIGVLFT